MYSNSNELDQVSSLEVVFLNNFKKKQPNGEYLLSKFPVYLIIFIMIMIKKNLVKKLENVIHV